MKKTKRYKEPQPKKASTLKIFILSLAIVLLASFFIWQQFTPKPVEEATDEQAKEPKVEETTKNLEPTPEIVNDSDEPPNPEGVVTYADPKSNTKSTTPPEKTQPDKTEYETTEPIIIKERVVERDQEAILASALPKVYTIYTDTQQGSGFLYSDHGDIVTNAHVVAGYSTVTVMNSTGQKFIGQVIGISDTIDVALIRVEPIAGKEPMAMDLMKSTEGTSVIAIGSPNNQSNTATMGKVTGVGSDFYEAFTYTDLYEIDAAIAPGSSGGPLLDAKSEKVIGINSIILTDNPSVGYSIPVYSIYQLLKSWEANPIAVKEPVQPKVEDAYFDEELLTVFIEAYMSLYNYAQNEVNFSYLEGYLLPGSQIYQSELATINSLKDQQKSFVINKFNIDDIIIEDKRAVVTTTTITEVTEKGKDSIEVSSKVVYEVIIDEYGDYMIEAITKP